MTGVEQVADVESVHILNGRVRQQRKTVAFPKLRFLLSKAIIQCLANKGWHKKDEAQPRVTASYINLLVSALPLRALKNECSCFLGKGPEMLRGAQVLHYIAGRPNII